MPKYDKVSTDLNFVEREKEVEQFWKSHDIFGKSIKNKEGCPTYMFYDGPPTANGKPHIGHVLTRVIKDMIPRYRTMKGSKVPRKAGWDTHGLPVELEVEKMLGLDGKEQIEEYGLEPFIAHCKESVWKYKGMWEDFSSTVGFWADMDNPYVTYHNDYIESEWWALKKIWERGLLYKGFKIVPYCPRCGTPLSSHEVAQGYKDVKERSAIARFKVKGEDAYILAWTTTPWTLPSNVGLCVNPDETYAKVKAADGYTYYMAEALLDTVLSSLADKEKETPAYEVLETYRGKDLEYKEYEPLFDYATAICERQHKKAFYVVCDNYVTLTDGTGVVHIAPAFGEDDSKVGKKYDLPFVQLVDTKGTMTTETPWEGVFVKKADPLVLKALEEKNLLFSAPSFEHSYPHCWRCDTPLIYYARESWFIKMTEVKEDLINNNNTINWIPESIGKGRFGDWLENVQDWGISRNRYWGTPLNIWECECGCQHSVGSIEELKSMSNNCPEDIELHRPFIDNVTIACPKCGKQMKRVLEVIDCWFDSGAMPFAQHHYPFENKELFEQQFPADFISEAVDQTRGWFYSLLAISTLLFNKAPYKNVIVLGHVQDENGQKMAKTKGNAVDPFEALSIYGADAIRWYFYINSAPWLPNRFHGKAVTEGQRKFMGTLWNTYAFFVLYANIDDFDPTKYTLDYEKLPVMDKWLLSKLNSLVKDVDSCLDNYQIPEAARALQAFVDDMSNWYVRRSRERFWAKGMEQDKINAYMTLYTALVTVSKAAAPMIPFMTESIYQNLVCNVDKNAPESIHLCDFPEVQEPLIDKQLETDMDEVLKVVVMGRAARNSANMKNRQPIGQMFVKAPRELSQFYVEIIEEELNVKKVVFTDDVREFTSYTFKPQLKTVGPKYGKQLNHIRKALSEVDGNKAMDTLREAGNLTFHFDGVEVVLGEEDLLIDMAQKEGYVTEADNTVTVVLDTNLTPELIEEGFVRELVSKIQTMRKEADFEVTDHIRVYEKGNDRLAGLMKAYETQIKADVLAEELFTDQMRGYTKDWNINGEHVTLGVEKIQKDTKESIPAMKTEAVNASAKTQAISSKEAVNTMEFDKEEFKRSIIYTIKNTYRKKLEEATPQELFQAVSYAVKDIIMDRWIATQKEIDKADAKTVYYLSMEFLMGRALGNNIINLCAHDQIKEVLDEMGLDLNVLEDQEPDPALGNGGLGRLAACFLDSLATLGYPAYGCGIRYHYGMFKQKIENGYQIEVPDEWLKDGNPFEIRRSEYATEVKFGGRVQAIWEDGKQKFVQEDYQSVLAVPYDMPIVGYGNNVVNTLRIWDARPINTFSLDSFDKGDYQKAVEQENLAKNICEVLYPNDNHYAGKELRLKQQYFFISASVQRAVKKYKRNHDDIRKFYEKNVFQLNDTHPTVAVPELMRILLDEEGLTWEEAWEVTTKTCAYTNHTIMAEALEKWPIDLFSKLLPRIYQIVEEINRRFEVQIRNLYPGDEKKVEKMAVLYNGQVRMAYLAIAGSFSVNGVARLHTEILKNQELKAFYEMMPEKFNNKTNGITQRRFLLHGNPLLAAWVTEKLGSDAWVKDLTQLSGLKKYAEDEKAQKEFMEIKYQNKLRLAKYIKEHNGIDVDPNSIFDVQVKRLHEYKRQLMNILHVMHLYNQLKDNPDLDMIPRTFIFGAKAAAGYRRAKLTIKLINAVAEVVNNDEEIKGKLKVVFIEDYRVSNAEIIFAAADVSEQISTASKEASGTGNMKFMLNGALTLGTMDGANVEIVEEVGRENAFIFGLSADEVINYEKNGGYYPVEIFNSNENIRRVMMQLVNGFYAPQDPNMFREIYDSLLNGNAHDRADMYFILKDCVPYAVAQREVDKAYRNKTWWAKASMLNVACSGKFSSDRTIQEYVDEVWHLDKIDVEI